MALKRGRKAVSSVIAGLIVIIIILAGLTGYAFLVPGSSGAKTVTQTTTVQGSGGGVSTVTTTVTASGQGGGSNLAALAQQEGGSITIYGDLDGSQWAANIQPAFMKLYPWAKINYVALGAGDISNRAISEFKAGKVSSDLLITTESNMLTVEQAGALQQWNNSAYELGLGYTNVSVDLTGYWHPAFVLPEIIIYNTHLVSASQAPKTYSDLANSQWKGKVVMQDPSLLAGVGTTLATLEPILGNATWTQQMQALAANNPVIISSNGAAFTDVAAGQYPVGFGQLNDYISAVQAGNNTVGAVFPNPVVGAPNVISITKGAQHPYMAELLTQWLTSPPGQFALWASGRPPMNPLIFSAVTANYVPGNVTILPGGANNPTFYSNPSYWSQTFKSIFG